MEQNLQPVKLKENLYCIDDNSDWNSSNSSILSSDEEGESFQMFNPTKKYTQEELEKLGQLRQKELLALRTIRGSRIRRYGRINPNPAVYDL